ncbi:hypothetical protein VPH35_051582 [Triticum aestivum]
MHRDMGSAPSSLPPRRRPGGALVKDVGEEKSSLLWSGLVGGVAAGSALVDVCRVGALAGCPQGQGERQVPWSWPGCGSSCLPVEKVGRCECSCSRGSLLLYAIATLGVGWGGVFGAASVPCPGPIYSSSLLFDSGAARYVVLPSIYFVNPLSSLKIEHRESSDVFLRTGPWVVA